MREENIDIILKKKKKKIFQAELTEGELTISTRPANLKDPACYMQFGYGMKKRPVLQRGGEAAPARGRKGQFCESGLTTR